MGRGPLGPVTTTKDSRLLFKSPQQQQQQLKNQDAGYRKNSSSIADHLDWLLQRTPFPTERSRPIDRNVGDRRVRRLCSTGKFDTLIFVHTDPTHERERNFYRSTLGHPALSSLFRWTLIFFVGFRPGVNVSAEARVHGDMVRLPYLDSYRNLTYKFVLGIRWVLLRCPSVQRVVKLDDDVFVHPELLHDYLRLRVRPLDRNIHCSVYQRNTVIRNPHSRHYLSPAVYPAKVFPRHCHGWFIVLPVVVMWELYAAAFRLPMHPIDDAYVTGDLAKLANVKFQDLTVILNATEDQTMALLRGEFLGMVFTGRSKMSVREELWKTLVAIKKRPSVDEAMIQTLKRS
ncbi:hypothetical protein HPB47_000869 [Ixodes persulcatus]|uniref:Uncharacterized protein n=1 Tax=Ixodes persulcatus TaxID=34615 RepID=A0AC60PQM6_IXOPE|nr:hypothetical protein HPB47_000869 [Ixodes persulcatus]